MIMTTMDVAVITLCTETNLVKRIGESTFSYRYLVLENICIITISKSNEDIHKKIDNSTIRRHTRTVD